MYQFIGAVFVLRDFVKCASTLNSFSVEVKVSCTLSGCLHPTQGRYAFFPNHKPEDWVLI